MTWQVKAFAHGRSEIAGNHTDHQGGKTVSATVENKTMVLLERNLDNTVRLESEGFESVSFGVGDLAPHASERNTTAALVRGILSGLSDFGVEVGGFDARVSSTVDPGSGLSSSAAFELALACGINELFGNAPLPPGKLASLGCAAERLYFGKPCGLQDQTAIAYGGISIIDFADRDNPVVERLDFDFESAGYKMLLIDTGCDHSRYNDEFAQLVDDMLSAAGLFGAQVLGEVDPKRFFSSFAQVRESVGDRAALRALHFYHESQLVEERIRALKAGDMDAFIRATQMSSASSAQYLQNVMLPGELRQPAMATLALASALAGKRGACRIHGGGFGGSVQAFVEAERVQPFTQAIDAQLGDGSAKVISFSENAAGASCL